MKRVVSERGWVISGVLGAALLALSCERTELAPSGGPSGAAAPPAAASGPVDLGSLRVPAQGRIVAIGDLHGDFAATQKALRLAGVLDEAGRWSGGTTTVVQTGDQLDRGDGEREILDLLERLAKEAEAAGGHLRVLNGNHETMNVLLDFRYVTPGGLAAFADLEGSPAVAPAMRSVIARLPEPARGRGAAFVPGGPYARKLAERPLALVVGDTAFAHGGILPKHLRAGLPKMDAAVRSWMRGEGGRPPAAVIEEDSPVWSRDYSDETDKQDCAVLEEALGMLGVKRMVVGHTVQKQGITSACDERVWRVDTGMAAHYGGPTQVLQIVGDEVTVLGK